MLAPKMLLLPPSSDTAIPTQIGGNHMHGYLLSVAQSRAVGVHCAPESAACTTEDRTWCMWRRLPWSWIVIRDVAGSNSCYNSQLTSTCWCRRSLDHTPGNSLNVQDLGLNIVIDLNYSPSMACNRATGIALHLDRRQAFTSRSIAGSKSFRNASHDLQLNPTCWCRISPRTYSWELLQCLGVGSEHLWLT